MQRTWTGAQSTPNWAKHSGPASSGFEAADMQLSSSTWQGVDKIWLAARKPDQSRQEVEILNLHHHVCNMVDRATLHNVPSTFPEINDKLIQLTKTMFFFNLINILSAEKSVVCSSGLPAPDGRHANPNKATAVLRFLLVVRRRSTFLSSFLSTSSFSLHQVCTIQNPPPMSS